MRRSLPIVLGLLAACAASESGIVEPALVQPNVISTDDAEFALTYEADGAAYFNRIIPGEQIHIWVAADRAAEPVRIAFSDPRYADLDPHVSPLGDRLYFSSDRPRPGRDEESPEIDMNTWMARKTDTGWSAPEFAGAAINSELDEVFVTEDLSGTLYFARFGEGEGRARPTVIMSAKRTAGGFTEPEALATRPADLRLSNPAISPDGRLLVTAGSAEPGAPPDLFLSLRSTSGAWSAFEALPAPINTAEHAEFAPGFSPDGRRLYFSSDRNGDRDIFVHRADQLWRDWED
ncbi:MAG: hypothetical protein AAFX03_14315 [Pseudomonadota bacterium]